MADKPVVDTAVNVPAPIPEKEVAVDAAPVADVSAGIGEGGGGDPGVAPPPGAPAAPERPQRKSLIELAKAFLDHLTGKNDTTPEEAEHIQDLQSHLADAEKQAQ